MTMNLLVIGKGGREHALAWKLAQSPRAGTVFCAPGNAGTDAVGVNVPIEATDFDKLIRFAKKEAVGLTVVGPEEPLVKGIVDHFHKHELRVFGPTREAAQVEASKVFAKELMARAGVPTPPFHTFTDRERAKDFVRGEGRAFVVKADGLAKGKGSIVPSSQEETLEAIDTLMLARSVGAAGDRILLEERIEGREVSLLALVDGGFEETS